MGVSLPVYEVRTLFAWRVLIVVKENSWRRSGVYLTLMDNKKKKTLCRRVPVSSAITPQSPRNYPVRGPVKALATPPQPPLWVPLVVLSENLRQYLKVTRLLWWFIIH